MLLFYNNIKHQLRCCSDQGSNWQTAPSTRSIRPRNRAVCLPRRRNCRAMRRRIECCEWLPMVQDSRVEETQGQLSPRRRRRKFAERACELAKQEMPGRSKTKRKESHHRVRATRMANWGGTKHMSGNRSRR